MRILVTGHRGQLGSALHARLADAVDVLTFDRDELDITHADQVQRSIKSLRPDLIINAAAYTNVDGAETDQKHAMLVNAEGPHNLVLAAERSGASLIHISTDYIFDGRKGAPYFPDDVPNPLNEYGRTKLAGEQAILQRDVHALIIRTSWLYGPGGHNFVRTMRRLIAGSDQVRVVNDQRGCPTSVLALAHWITLLIDPFLQQRTSAQTGPRIIHMACSGDATWYDFARVIFEHAGEQDRLIPVDSNAYPTAARRPADSRLDSESSLAMFRLTAVHWLDALQRVLAELSTQR